MSNFKAGDRVKINREYDVRYNEFGTVTRVSDEFGDAFIVFDSDNRGAFYKLRFLELIEMPKFVEVKTKTIKKYAVVEVSNGSDYLLKTYYTEQEVAEMNQEQSVYENGYSYHIVPTLFFEEVVPVKTETRYTFICKGGEYSYYGTSDKYKDLAEAKAATMDQAIQQIDSSAEEFEIE